MKRYIFSIGILFSLVALIHAQSHVDALRYSQHTVGGTARSVAMSGAFGALGGDFSSLSHNPAGLGLYRSSEFTFTPEFYLNNTTTRYWGNEVEEQKFNINVSNLGYVANFEQGAGPLKAFNFGVGFNRIANFHRNSVIQADNPYTTYSERMAAELTDYGFDYFSFFTSALFFDGGLVYNAGDVDSSLEGIYWANDEYYDIGDSTISFRPTEQLISNYEEGKINEWVISAGFNFGDILYIGTTLGIQPLRYRSEKSFKEYDVQERSFNYFTFNEYIDVKGTGYTGKIGAIFRPIPLLRIGAAFHLPVYYDISESYNTNLLSGYYPGDIFHPSDNEGYRVDELKSDYSVTTPYKAIGSVGVILGKLLILSGDIEYIDYSSMRMKAKDFDLSEQNEIIKEVYTENINVKTGAEMRLGSLYLRGGFAYYGSPYNLNEENVDAFQLSYSGGLGFRNNGMFFDVAFQYTNYDERSLLYQTYDINDVWRDNPVNYDNKNMRVMTTIGFKF